MDALLRALSLAQKRLDEGGFHNAVIGGLAVAAWGRPRLTDDVDLKVQASRKQAAELVDLLQPEFQPVEQALEHAQATWGRMLRTRRA